MRPPHFKHDKILFYNHQIFKPLFLSSDTIKSLYNIKEFNNIDNQIFILSFIIEQIPMFDIKMNNHLNNYNNYQNITNLIISKYQYQSERLLINLNDIKLSPLTSSVKNKEYEKRIQTEDKKTIIRNRGNNTNFNKCFRSRY